MKRVLFAILVILTAVANLKAADYYNETKIFVFLRSDDVELTPQMMTYLDGVANYMEENPETVVKIVGHSESVMTTKQQQYISEARAQAAVIYLNNKGISQSRVLTSGEGASKQIYGFEQSSKNNRIEINVFIPGVKPNIEPSSTQYDTHNRTSYSGGHHVHSHHLALFGGATTNLEVKHTDPTAGIDYEFRLPFWDNVIGIGIFGEAVFAEHIEFLAGGLIIVHPIAGLKVFAGGGAVRVEHTVQSIPETIPLKIKSDRILANGSEETEVKFEPLIRGGIGYDFHFEQFSIGPVVSADYINKNTLLVYGLSLGIGF